MTKKMNVTNAILVKAPFDLDCWSGVALSDYPNGLLKPRANDPLSGFSKVIPAAPWSGTISPSEQPIAQIAPMPRCCKSPSSVCCGLAEQDAGVLRSKPNIHWPKDREQEPFQEREQFRRFWRDGKFTAERVNDIHLSTDQKSTRRTAQSALGRGSA